MPDFYMDVDTALAEVPVNLMPLVDDTDFKAIEGAVVYNAAGLALRWHFVTTTGAYTVTSVTPTTGGDYDWTDQGDSGVYTIEIPASGGATINNDTEGFGWFTGVATGILPWRGPTIGFRAAGLNDALIDSAWSATRGLTGTAVPAAAAGAAGGLPTSTAGSLDLDAKLANTNEVTVARMGALTDLIDGGRLDLLIDAIKAMTDKIGTISNTGGTATIGAILGDFLNTTLTGRVPTGAPGAANGAVTTNGTKVNQTVDLTAGQSIDVSDKTGFSLSATGADLILKSSTFVQAIVAAINEFATYGLTAINTLLVATGIKTATTAAPADMATATELAKVPKSDSTVTWNATALASILTQVATALDTAFTDATSLNADGLKGRLRILQWILRNKMTVDDTTGDLLIYKDDGVTVAFTVSGALLDVLGVTTRKRIE